MSKSGIHIKPENKGKFNALKKRTGKSTEELTHSKNPLTRKRAVFAQNAKKWHHANGGYIKDNITYIPTFENVDEYGLGSWLSGAGGGAAAGLSAGPWGAVIGGTAGLIGSIAGDSKQKQIAKEQARQQKLMQDQAIAQQRLGDYNNMDNGVSIPTFAMGGGPDDVFQKREQYINSINKPLKKTGKYFTVNDIANGRPGIRHGTKVDKGVLDAIAKAAANEGVPLMDALTVAMRETGMGYRSKSMLPREIMQAHNSETIADIPMDYDQWRMKNNRVDKKYVSKDTSGYLIDMAEPDESKNKHIKDYDKYLTSFKYDPTLSEPFRKEMRFLKVNAGQKYNPGEKDRMTKLAREKSVIMANKDLYHYADSVYNTHKKALGGNLDELSQLKGYGYNLMATGGHLPEGKATLKDAKEYLKLYPKEMEMGEEVEHEHTGNKKLAQRIAADHIKDHLTMTGGDPSYYTRLKASGISDELNKMAMGGPLDNKGRQLIVSRLMELNSLDSQPILASGGHLSASKAKEMLKDGTAHKKPLTDKQRKYFQAIAHGMHPNKALGGDLPIWGSKTPYFEEIDNAPEHRNYAYGGGVSMKDFKGPQSYSISGSLMDSTGYNEDDKVTEYEGGGSHEQNSLGGIPIGDKARVEAGEVKVKFKDGEYIFSDRY